MAKVIPFPRRHKHPSERLQDEIEAGHHRDLEQALVDIGFHPHDCVCANCSLAKTKQVQMHQVECPCERCETERAWFA